ncbi:hypothetical protein [Neobacillus dielmonensis]|uniref:hypothetical protein n=1 Tax=Neobacillus dielmonensis TaxID=1347369 RepID=UPI000693FBAD|nr:hypothetical protein [Neobacillus dielmonensis]
MKLHLSKKHNMILGIVALVLVLLIVYAQFMMLSPLKTDLETKQQSLDSEKKLLEVVTKKQQDTTNKVVESTRELQKKLPIKPLEEQIVLDLEKAEIVASSQIQSMSFAQDGTVEVKDENANAQQNTDGQTTDQTQQKTTQADSTAQQTATGDQAAQQTAATAPVIKKVTVQLSVESPSYTEFEKFVDTLESLNRIVVVEGINYSGGKEITDVTSETEVQKLSYTLTVSAFYMPELADLEVDVPKIEAPAPAGKENPLFQFPSVTKTP